MTIVEARLASVNGVVRDFTASKRAIARKIQLADAPEEVTEALATLKTQTERLIGQAEKRLRALPAPKEQKIEKIEL